MLERIREGSQGIVAKTILGLVILTFAISGIGSYINSKADSAVAVVNDVEITASSFDQAYQNQRARMQQQYGDFVEQLMADENYVNRFRQNVLNSLIVDELQKQAATDVGVRVGDEQVKQAIFEMPEFQQGGTFNNEIYLANLRQWGLQPNQFRELLRKDIANQQYSNAVMGTEFILPSEKNAFVSLLEQTRRFSEIELKVSDYLQQVTVNEQELNEYYEANKFSYKTEEKISVEYVVVDSETMKSDIEVSEDEKQLYYEQNIGLYSNNAERKVAHILIEFGDDKESAKAKVIEIQNKLNEGQSFADLANQYSNDTFSAENGGDLGWLEPGLMGEQFETAVASLNQDGQVSDIVETDFGYHLIKLTDFKPEVVKPYDEVKEQIETAIVDNLILERYIAAQTELVETAFEVPDTLSEAAQAANLVVQKTGLVARSKLPAMLANPIVSARLFDEDFRNERLNSDLLEISDSQSVVVRVDDYVAPQTKTFEQVEELVKNAVKQDKTRKMIEERAEELLTKLSEGQSLEQLGLPVRTYDSISRDQAEMNAELRNKVFALEKPQSGQTTYDKVTMRNGDVSIVALHEVIESKDVTIDDEKLAQLEGIVSRVTSQAYINALKANAEININL